MAGAPIGYLALLRRNRTFRRLWLGDVVSLTGDWFTTITLFALLLEFTGKGEAVGLALIARFLPGLLLGPLAGVVADRFPRKAILVVCDVLRAGVVLGYFFVRSREDTWLAYLLCFVQSSVAAFFDPCEQASVGSVVVREEVVAANALQGATWSAMLAVGALVGGAFSHLAGRNAAFAVNSATYLLSAAIIATAAIPRQPPARAPTTWRGMLGIDDLSEGLRFIAREPNVRRVIMAKAGWGMAGGGAILLYSVYGERVFPVGEGASIGIGVLYASRGLGALLGPTLARVWGGDSEPALDRAIGYGFVVLVASYSLLAIAPWLALGAVALALAHVGSSTIWTFSTSLLNLNVPDALRGRVFAADIAVHTLVMILSIWATSFGLDHLGLSPRTLMGALAAVVIIPLVAWRLLPRHPAPEPAPAPALNPIPEIRSSEPS